MRASFGSRSISHVTRSRFEGIRTSPLCFTTSDGSRPEMKTPEQRTLVKPASSCSCAIPAGRYADGTAWPAPDVAVVSVATSVTMLMTSLGFMDRIARSITAAMAARTGAEYLAGLRDQREVWCGGERVKDVTAHPLLGRTAHT